MKRQWKFLKCEKCVNHGKCKEEKRLRKMRFLIPGCMAEIMPMTPGMACAFNDCGTCCRVVAKIRALTLAKKIISSELKKLQNIMIMA